MHCKAKQAKLSGQKDSDEEVKIRSKSDLYVLQHIKDIDRVMRLAQGNLNPNANFQQNKAKVMWGAMFPHYIVDDSFLNSTEEIITIHSDGKIVNDYLGSKTLEDDLQFYLKMMPSSEDEDEDKDCSKFVEKQTYKTPSDISPASLCVSRKVSSNRNLSQQNTEKIGQSLSKHTTSKCDELDQGKTVHQTASKLQENERILPAMTSTNTSGGNLWRKTPSSSCANRKYSDSMITLHMTSEATRETVSQLRRPSSTSRSHINTSLTDVSQICLPMERLELKRPTTSPGVTVSLSKVKLPSLDMKGKQPNKIKGKRSQKNPMTSQSTFLLPISEQETKYNYLLSSCRMEPVIYEYPNLNEANYRSAGSYRSNNKSFIRAIASEACAGKPLEHYLRSRRNTTAVILLHFWQRSHEYLSLKSLANQSKLDMLRFRQAQALILRHLQQCSMEQVVLPAGLNSSLQQLLPYGHGDDLLVKAQDITAQVRKNSSLGQTQLICCFPYSPFN